MDLSDVSPEMLAEKLTRGGLEVEGMEKMAQGTNLIIGHVLSCVPHPNSDHLHVCQVNTGEGVRQIVCGAPNVAAGQKVIVALPGCVLPGGEIKSGVVRGELSDGMICALFELGVDRKQLTEQQLAGIEVLPDDAPVGNRNVLEYLGLDDIIYDVSLTPNRADCLSVWALAKEVGAMLNKPVTLPDYHYECKEIPTDLIIRSETEKCPLFWGKVINKVVIKPSPKWLVQALHGAGIKAINNVVDISNYVMLETGQPLHFYDLAKIPGKEITVKQGLRETYTALDGIEYPIYEDDIMITNQGKAIGIAGIMGGDDSKIDEETHGIIIEAAHFNNVCIRNTSRRLDLNTEAATRFTKGLDPLGGRKAVERSVQLLLQLADADGIEETVLCGSEGYEPLALDASVSRINKLLGTQFGYEAVKSAFERLDFQPEKVDEDTIRCHIPSYRRDITCWQDLSEETVRLLGYENIRSTLPLMPTVQGGLPPYKRKKRVLQQMLNGFGLSEIISYSLVSRQKIDEGLLPIGEPVRIANAISEERRFFRSSLSSSMLETVSYNLARSNKEYGLFEISNVYEDGGREESHLCIAMSENTGISKWQKESRSNDFYTMKGLIYELLDRLGYDEKRLSVKPLSSSNEVLNPYKSAELYLGNKKIGVFGVVHPLCKKKYDLDDCVIGEISLTAIYEEKAGKIRFTPVNRYPAVTYDLAFICDESVSGQQIVQTVKKAAGRLLKDVEIFDIYRGSNIPEGKKSVAINIVYQSAEKTLAESDINPVHSEVIRQLTGKLHVNMRDS